MVDLIFGALAPYIAAAVGGLVMFLAGRRQANNARRNEEIERRFNDMKKAQGVRDEVDTLDDDGLADRAARWLHKREH